MIFVFLSSRIKNTSVLVLIDSAGHTGVVLLCCGISIRKSEVKDIEWKLSWNWEKRYIVLTSCMYSCCDFIVFYRIIWILEVVWMKYKILVVDDDIFIWRIVEYNGGQVARRKLCLFFKRPDRFFPMQNPICGYSAFSLSTFNPFKFIPVCSSTRRAPPYRMSWLSYRRKYASGFFDFL